MDVVPFHSFLWRLPVVATSTALIVMSTTSRISPETKPHYMSIKTARRAAERMRDHLQGHGKKTGAVIFHGGEPLLLALRMSQLVRQIRETFDGTGVETEDRHAVEPDAVQ